MRRWIATIGKQAVLLPLCAALTLGQSHSVSLNWNWEQDGGGQATGFNIKRGNTTGGPYALIGAVGDPSIVTYTDTGPFVEGATYYYVATAVGPGGESAPSNEASATIPASTPLASSFDPSTVGQAIVFTLSLPAFAYGAISSVQFFDGSVLLGTAPVISGQATFTTATLKAGSHVIIATDGNGDVLASRGQVVYGMPSTTTISAQPANPSFGQSVLLTVQLGPSPPTGFTAPSGTVMFQDNGYPIGSATASSGSASLPINVLAIGTHVITAIYGGDAVWASSYTRISVTVTHPILQMENAAAATVAMNFAPDEAVDLFNVTVLRNDASAPSLPLPTSLLNTTVSITDSAGVTRLAPLYGVFGSSSHIRFVVPSETALGPAVLTVTVPGGSGLSTGIMITRTAPGIFTANANGQGVYAGQVVHVHSDGSQTSESSAIFDYTQGAYVPNPVDLGPSDDQVFLVLYGTGIRHRMSDADVTATIQGIDVSAESAAQGVYPGLDQINLQLPRELAGAGSVSIVLTVEGVAANPVLVSIH